MPDLNFRVEGAEPQRFAAEPTLLFRLRLSEAVPEGAQPTPIHSIVLRCQIRIEPARRRYSPQEKQRLLDLPVPCSFDFSLAATRYFAALEEGDLPLDFLFSGTIFYQAAEGPLQVAQIPWEKDATFRLPVATWRGLMDLYYPNSAWLCLRRDVFDRLDRYRSRGSHPTWEQALERLLASAEEPVTP